uniref:Integrase catalytic domain-containing protein n=1 Tax=Tanacetum cinerariifolium TaxID=118510 RepID=A0A6L2KE23_TANCI|nr:hypothetical protein [Tanacetum cinerariifolium]
MSTRSSARNLFPPLDNPKLTIRRRSRVDPTFLNDFEMATEGNGDPPVPDLQTMEELCQPSLNALKDEMAEINKNLMKVLQVNQQVKPVTPSCETCGGPHSYNDCPTTVGQTQNVYAVGAYQGGNSYQPQGNRNLLSYHSDNYLEPPGFNQNQNRNNQNQNFQNQNRNQGNNHSIPQGNNQRRNQFFQGASHGPNPPPAYQAPAYQASGYQAPVHQPLIPQPQVVTTANTPKPNQKLSIPYASRLHDQKLRDKANDQKEKFFQIFQDLNFNISFADALILMPKFGPTIKTLLTNKDKLYELARTLLNEHCSTVLLKKLLEKLGDPDKFLIPCDFPRIDECLDLADLGASINLMPLSVWNNLSLPGLTPTLMTLKLADRSISRPIGVVEDIFVKVGKFHFPTDFVVVDYDADPRVPVILGRSFLKTRKSLIDVYEERIDSSHLSVKEKSALVKVLKSHKQAIAWKLSDIKGINPKFCTHKILMEDDFKPAVQHQRRVNLKIHDVIKKEVLKVLNAGLIYSILDSPWEKSHFMVKEGIVLCHKISKNGIEVDKAKVDVIVKLAHPTTVKGVVLGKRQEKHFRPINYAGKTMNEAESQYTTTEKEMLVVVEAKGLPTNDAQVVCKFLKSLFARFGTPHAIISDRGNGYHLKDKIKAKSDKTEHEMESMEKLKVNQNSANMMATTKVPMLKPENGPTLQKTQVVKGVTTLMPITSVEDKAQRRLEVKARNTLMMGIPNEHHIKFNSIKDVRQLMEAIEKRFGGNVTTKKTQRNLLKQQYENFTVSNSEMLDQTFDRLQKLRNKADLDTMSMDDLYNNLKVYEPEVKGMSSSNASIQNMYFVSSLINNNTNRVVNTTQAVNTALGVSTDGTQVNTASIDNLSGAVICVFLASQPNGHVDNEGQKVLEENKKEADCQCSKKSRYQAQGKPRSIVLVETPASTALVSCDGLGGYDWSDQAEESSNYALMAYTSISSDSKNPDAPIVEDYVSDDEEENVTQPKIVKKIVKPSIPEIEFVKTRQQEKTAGKNVKKTYPHAKRNMDPRAVLLQSGIVNTARHKFSKKAVLDNTARQVSTTHPKSIVNVARPKSHLSKTTHSTVKSPIYKKTAFNNSNVNQRVNTVRCKTVNTARPKVVVNAVQGNVVNADYEEIDEGYVALGGNPKGGKITGKCTIKTGKLDFKNVYFVRELKFNIFSVSQMCDKKNSVLFNDTECIVLSPNFKLIDESQVLLRIPRKNIVPKEGLTCLFAKATSNEFKLWHRRLGHLNFKTMNKLVKENLVRGLPSKHFENVELCCLSEEKTTQSLFLIKEMYFLVVTDDYSRFTWVFFLSTKDETSGILKSFITRIENLVDHKGILRQNSVARSPQQNKVAERRNKTLIEAAKTMLADLKLPTTFWAEAVNTACYMQNRVLVVKPHNKTPYELFHSRTPTLSFMKPLGCPVKILNTLDHLGSGLDWLFDIDALTRTINYKPIVAGTQSNSFIGTKACDNAGQARKEKEPVRDYILLPLWTADLPFSQDPKSSKNDGFLPLSDSEKKVDEDPSKKRECRDQEQEDNVNNTNNVIVATTNRVNTVSENINPSWIEAMHEELLPFKLQEVWTLVDLSNGKRAIGTKWVFWNTKDERGIVIRNKARLVAQGHIQEEGIDYDELFAPVVRIKAIRLFLVYSSFKDFVMYQMNVKSAFLYGKIEKETMGFTDEKIDNTLFIRRHKGDILLVQIYVDDIIFGLTKKELCNAFEKMMHENFQMSSMGELTFFLGLQVKYKQDGIFISQDKYVVCACARYQINLKVSHLHTMKRIFRYLKGQPKFSLWYLKDSSFDLVAYTDSDYARASLDMKSTTGDLLTKAFDYELMVNLIIYTSCIEQLWATVKAKTVAGEVQLQSLVDGKKVIITESTIRRDPQLEDAEGVDCLPNATSFELLTLIGETPLFLTMMVQAQEEMGEGSANPTDPHHTPTIIQPLTSQPQKKQKPRKIKRKDTELPQTTCPTTNIVDEAINEEMNDSLERAVTTASSLEAEYESSNINKTQSKVTPNESSSQGTDSGGGTRIESFNDIEDLGEDASKQGRISDIDADEGITLFSTHDDAKMFDADKDLHGEEVFFAKQDENVVEKEVDAAQVQVSTVVTTATISIDEVTLAQALSELKHTKPKAKDKGIDKGKAIMIEEPVKLKKKDQIMLDEEVALKLEAELQAEFDKEQSLASKKAQQEQEVNEKMRKFFTTKAVEEKRNKPPTQAQQRKIMCTYLKNMEVKKLKDVKNKSFDSIQKMFNKAFKRVNTFEPIKQESSKKQKIDDDKETTELKQLVKIIQDEEWVVIDAIPLAVKPPSIVDWEIHKEGKKSFYKIIRADGSLKIYLVFSHMLKSFDREDVETL